MSVYFSRNQGVLCYIPLRAKQRYQSCKRLCEIRIWGRTGWGGGGGGVARFTNRKNIESQISKLCFPNHESKQEVLSLITCSYARKDVEESKIVNTPVLPSSWKALGYLVVAEAFRGLMFSVFLRTRFSK